MATFSEANQVRVALKMKLSAYSWYSASGVSSGEGAILLVLLLKDLTILLKSKSRR